MFSFFKIDCRTILLWLECDLSSNSVNAYQLIKLPWMLSNFSFLFWILLYKLCMHGEDKLSFFIFKVFNNIRHFSIKKSCVFSSRKQIITSKVLFCFFFLGNHFLILIFSTCDTRLTWVPFPFPDLCTFFQF